MSAVPNGLLVAAPRSGSGKTTVTLMLLAALRRRGLAVRAAKNGPDYIDPAFHEAAAGRPSPTLDSWAMPPATLDAALARAAAGADLLVVEGSMGLFDGVDGPDGRRGRTADLARRWRLPVLLVVDASGQSQSVAALARGFAVHEPGVAIAGVVLNRLGSARHEAQATAALEAVGLPVLGALRRDAVPALPERHLGLVQAREVAELPVLLERLATLGEEALALDRILAAAVPVAAAGTGTGIAPLPPPGQRVAIAADAAFSFLYPHLVAGWREMGAELCRFSPLDDQPPPASADSCWLPGGYPELHAGRIAAAERFRAGLAAFAATRPVHGECGGYMVLGRALTDAAGTAHRMADLLDHETDFSRRHLHLGYREAVLRENGVLGAAGTRLRGHEFHYASERTGADRPLAELFDSAGAPLGPAGGRRGTVSGSFFHLIARDAAP